MIIGDQDAAARAYVHVGIFLLGAVFAVLVLASRATDQAGDRRRTDHRRHAEDLALMDERADRHERDIRQLIDLAGSLGESLPQLEERVGKLERKPPPRSRAKGSST